MIGTGRERVLVGTLVVAALACRVGLGLAVAPLQAPDEEAHLRYVETLVRDHRLPVQPESPFPHWEQSYQPPLAYLLFAATDRARSAALVGPPVGPKEVRLRWARVLNALYGAATVLVGYFLIARLTPPGDVRRILVAAVIALFPGFAGNAAILNNDALANLIVASLWLALVPTDPARPRPAWVAGAVYGAACLAKLSVLAQAPLLFLVPWLQRPRDFLGAVRRAAIAGVVATALLLPWMIRNHHVYGNPLAIGVGSISFEQLATMFPQVPPDDLGRPLPGRAFLEFWGRSGIYNNLHWNTIPWILAPLTAFGVLGWVRRSSAPAAERLGGVALASGIALALAAAAMTSFSFRFYGAWQGRYLYTAMVPFAILFAGGWERWMPPRARLPLAIALIVGLVFLDVALIAKLHAFFSQTPAPRWGLTTNL